MDEHSEALAAAIAAMRAEWATVGPEVRRKEDPGMDEEEQTESLRRRAALLRDFMTRHRVALEAQNPDPKMLDLAPLDAAEKEFSAADEAVREMEERLLQARANLAEASQGVGEGLLGVLAGLEALSPEQWAEMEPTERRKMYEVLRQLQEVRPGLLAELPVERRRHWEQQ